MKMKRDGRAGRRPRYAFNRFIKLLLACGMWGHFAGDWTADHRPWLFSPWRVFAAICAELPRQTSSNLTLALHHFSFFLFFHGFCFFFLFFLFNGSLKRFPINALKGSRFKEWENCTLRFDIFNLVFRVTNVFIRFSADLFLALNKFELKQNRLPNFLNNSKIFWEYRGLNIVCQQRLYT